MCACRTITLGIVAIRSDCDSLILCAPCRARSERSTRNNLGISARCRNRGSSVGGSVRVPSEKVRGRIRFAEAVDNNGDSARTINAVKGKGTVSTSRKLAIIVEIAREKPRWSGNPGDVRRLRPEYWHDGDATDSKIQRSLRRACDAIGISILPLRDADGDETDTIPSPNKEGGTWFYRAELRGDSAGIDAIAHYWFITSWQFPLDSTVPVIATGSGTLTESARLHARESKHERIEQYGDSRRYFGAESKYREVMPFYSAILAELGFPPTDSLPALEYLIATIPTISANPDNAEKQWKELCEAVRGILTAPPVPFAPQTSPYGRDSVSVVRAVAESKGIRILCEPGKRFIAQLGEKQTETEVIRGNADTFKAEADISNAVRESLSLRGIASKND